MKQQNLKKKKKDCQLIRFASLSSHFFTLYFAFTLFSPAIQGPAHPDCEVFLAFEKMLPYLEPIVGKRQKTSQGSDIK